jgi:hypothetical protein
MVSMSHDTCVQALSFMNINEHKVNVSTALHEAFVVCITIFLKFCCHGNAQSLTSHFDHTFDARNVLRVHYLPMISVQHMSSSFV